MEADLIETGIELSAEYAKFGGLWERIPPLTNNIIMEAEKLGSQ
jgi:hypothetical protein